MNPDASQEPDIDAYTRVMEEIKLRTTVVHSFMSGFSNAVYRATQIESTYLQIRMILELVALASLAANKVIFEQNQLKFHKHWNPADIMRDIEKLNPGFYPSPIREAPSSRPGVVNDLQAITSGFLTREELVSYHGRCANMLHAQNPFGRDRDYDEYERQIHEIMEKIRLLLNSHKIQLLGEQDFFYLVHMQEERDTRVHSYKFGRIPTPKP
ncbi:MAG: hypothetical protein AB7I98_23110 [Verrucomicrobiales bacterium]|nr:hypothetical protein [Verrucomicrobiae bacterium]